MRCGKTVWLVGMMGAGKSRVGAALARRLGWRFVDTDAEVERASGTSIREIFEKRGEASFRKLESAVIEALGGEDCVAAVGGGAIAQPGARERLAASGTVVYLRARPESLRARVGNGAGRPLLEGADARGRLARLRALLAERAPHYESASIVVDTDELGIDEVVEVVARRLEEVRREASP